MIRDIKRNSQGIIISTQLDDMGEDYSYIQLERPVRKFNRNANNSSNSNFNEIYDDRITDIEFEEVIIPNTYIFLDGAGGREINPNETDPAFFILEPNPNITENIPDEDVDDVGGVGSVGGTTTSAGGSTGMLNPTSGGSGGVMNPNNVSGSGDVFVGGSSGDGSSGDSSGAILFPFGVIGEYQNELRYDSAGLAWVWDLGLNRWIRQGT